MSFPRYPEYKDSGVEWLGAVPGHWAVKPLKHACCVFPSNVDKKSYDGETPVLLCNYTDVYYNDTIVSGTDFMAATATEDQVAKFTLRAGDTIITKDSETADDIAIAAYVPADLPGVICGYHLSMIRPTQEANGAFVKRLFDSTYVKSCVAVRANGLTRVGLGQYEIDNLDLPFPPFPEQTQIAAFLDRETAKIDELVAEQRRLMALLKEKRQAVISHAVTRGLNPNAPMKPSGIEWLGNVPEHWRVGKCGFYLSILSGFAFPSVGFSEDETDTKLLRGINVGISRLKWNETVYWRRVPDDGLDNYEMQAGDLVIGMDRPLISEGMRVAKVKSSDLPCLLLQRVASLKTGIQLDADYLLGLLSSEMFVAHFSPDTTGVSVPHISPEQINNFVIPVPPVVEQKAIVEFVGIESAKFDTLTTEAQRAIDLLQERRTALISAAVTGQIDMRGAV
jgi:type I restriction enzyme S subunit